MTDHFQIGRNRAHRGTSLVEVLVAMVILLFGIFSLVRLFPAGFTTILYGRNVSMAQALAHAMQERAWSSAQNLPDVVMAFNPLTGTTYPSLPPADELTIFQPVANQAPDTRFSDLNKIRRVLGETTRIPAPVTNSPYMPTVGGGQRAAVSPYTLTFSPIYSVVTTKTGLGGIFVYAGNSLNRVMFSGPPTADQMASLDTASYGIDYGEAMLYFKPVPYPRTFKLDYSFTVPQGANNYTTGQARPDTQILIAANQANFDLKMGHGNQLPLPNGARLEPNSEQLYQSFVLLGPGQPFSNDNPYQFKVLNPVLGIIGFSPLAATLGAGGPQSSGITAKIDYDVDDWHIIQEQRVVPAAAPYNVKLTLDHVEQAGAVDEYQEMYDRLMKDYQTPVPNERPSPTLQGVDLIVMDEETGLTMDSRSLLDAAPVNGIIDYREGAIQFNPLVQWDLPDKGVTGVSLASPPKTAPAPIAGKRIRIYYRTQRNWGMQLTKAATNYYRQPDFHKLGYREYTLGSNGYLFFPIQDHDQAVLVDYTWRQLVQGQQIIRTEVGEYHQILDPTLATSPQNQFAQAVGNVNQNPNWWIQVDGAARGDAVPGSVSITRIRGVSVRARVIWVEGSTRLLTAQGVQPVVRWRKLDLDSYVGRDRGT